MSFFAHVGLQKELSDIIHSLGYENPTPVQEKVIPFALEGKDIIGSSQTGTGKTAAYGIPLVSKIISGDIDSGIVIAPTRELAVQIMDALRQLMPKNLHKKTALLISGKNYREQCASLKRSPKLIVGTPGRINDHLERGILNLSKTSLLVLDETDRMLDMGFSIQIDEIIKFLPEKKQTLLFSATFPKKIVFISKKYLNDPVKITIEAKSAYVDKIDHKTMFIEEDSKYNALLDELKQRDGSVVVFVNTKRAADKIAYKLQKNKERADAIHGDLKHGKREKVISFFKGKKSRVLVATDVAARGLDIPHVEHVINYDIPMCPEDYIHRIGRTARAGRSGQAIAFISSQQKRKWHAVDSILNPEASKKRDCKAGSSGNKSRSRKSSGSKFGRNRSNENESGSKKSSGSKFGRNRSNENEFGSKKSSENKFGRNRSNENEFGSKKSSGNKFGRNRSNENEPGSKKSSDGKSRNAERKPSFAEKFKGKGNFSSRKRAS